MLKPAPKFMGDKVTVLEGALTPGGSEGPLKLKKLDGTVLEAGRMELLEGGSMKLLPPVKIVAASGVVMESGTGTLDLKPDGSFSTEGQFSIQSHIQVAGQDEE
ncbi:MAG: hypothetical protein QM755_13315 [Luteolibacter sp.]